MSRQIDVKELYLQKVSVEGDGMNLEVCNGMPNGSLADEGPYPIAWFRADVEGEIRFVLETPDATVSLPVSELERAIALAKSEVHSEDFYDDSDSE